MRLEILKEKPEIELQEILVYWKNYTVDDKFEGFAWQLDWKNEGHLMH